jgi:hypothetical protein
MSISLRPPRGAKNKAEARHDTRAAGHDGGAPGDERTSLRHDDPVAFDRWLNALREHIDDALAAGYDATRPVRQRRLSRVYAGELLQEAEDAIRHLLAMGARPGRAADPEQPKRPPPAA